MDFSKLQFWKKNSKSSKGSSGLRRREYGYGYGLLRNIVRVPQLGVGDLFWVVGFMLIANAFMVISLFKFYLAMEDYSHAILVPVIAAVAGWISWTRADEKPRVVGEVWGFPIVAAGLAIQFVAMWYEIGLVAGGVVSEYFTSVGLVISSWGLFICFFGFKAMRLFWFPLAYLVFMIPGLPGPPEQWLKNVLRNIVTAASAGVLENVFRYDVFVERNTMEIAGHSAENLIQLGVEDACSGIRSLWAMLAVAPAIAWFLRLRPFLIGLFLPLGVFLAIFQNIIRVIVTAILCDFAGMDWAAGTKHELVGGASFFLSAIILVLLSTILAPPPQPKKEAQGSYGTYGVYGSYGAAGGYGTYGGASTAAYHAANDPEAEEEGKEEIDAGTQREYYFSRIESVRMGVFAILTLMLIGQLALFQRYAIRSRVQYNIAQSRKSLDEFPGEMGQYKRIYWGELPETALQILNPSESYVGWYATPDNKLINVIINFWEPVIGFNGNSWAFPHSPDVCFREAGWVIEEPVPVPADLQDSDEIMYSRMYQNNVNRQMVLYWYNRDEVTRFMNEFINEDLADDSDPEGMVVAPSGDTSEYGKTDSSYMARMRHMVRSWSRPKDYSRYQYSIGIYVQEQGTREETIELAQSFARELRKHIKPFGLMPLQKMNMDNIEGSLGLGISEPALDITDLPADPAVEEAGD
jgi:exosortase